MVHDAVDFTTLGTLARLPFELRALIWDYVIGEIPVHAREMQEFKDSFARTDVSGELKFNFDKPCVHCEDDIKTSDELLETVLEASDDIWEEVKDALNHKQVAVARFVLPTADGNPRGPSYVSVYRSNSLIARLRHAYLDFDGYHRPSREELEHFVSIPWNLFETIKIEMEAPQDAADLIRLWTHIICICDALFMVKPLPAIEIYARNSNDGARRWGLDGIPSKSIPWPAFFKDNPRLLETYIPMSDLELLLSPFRRLTGARAARVYLASRISDDRLQTFLKGLQYVITEDHMFRHSLEFSDFARWILQQEDERTVILDAILDDLDGQNARMVRLQRFSTWNKNYVRNTKYRTLGDAFEDKPSGPWPTPCFRRLGIPGDIRRWVGSACSERLLGRRAFRQASPDLVDESVLETLKQDLNEYGLPVVSSAIYINRHDDEPFELYMPDWWAYYPTGIPKKSSDEYMSRVKEYLDWEAMN